MENAEATPAGHLRRQPTQARSRERVARILDAAAAIVDEDGSDALRVDEIARRAEVPLGTLYQFFARKDDIVYALAERFALRFGEVLEHQLAETPEGAGWKVLMANLFAAYADLYRTEPALRELWVGARLDPDFIRADHEQNNPRFATAVADRLAPVARVEDDELRLMILATWEATQALFEAAFRADPAGDPEILQQAQLMSARYLAPAFEDAQGSSPSLPRSAATRLTKAKAQSR